MSDWCAWIEKKEHQLFKIIDDPEITDDDFWRMINQMIRYRLGLWKEGQI